MNASLLLENACLDAARRYNFDSTVNLYKGSDAPDGGWDGAENPMKLPALIFHVTGAEPYVQHSAARRCRLRVIVRTQCDDESDADHLARSEEIFSWITGSAFAPAVSSYDGLTLLLLVMRGDAEARNDRHLESSIDLDVDVVPANL